MDNFMKVVRLGILDRVSVYAKIEFNDGRLSISGVEGPRPNGNARSCGQIEMHLDAMAIELAPGWTRAKLNEFLRVWRKWHLNDMKAGTPAQTAELEKHKFPGYPKSHYDWALEVLTQAGLQPDNGYSYGSAWLKVEVPNEVLDFLRTLPDTDKTPAWV